MHDVVFDFALTAKVGIEHLTDGRGAVRKADVLYAVAVREEVLDQECALGGLAAAVEALEDKQLAAFRRMARFRNRKGLGGEAVRALLGTASLLLLWVLAVVRVLQSTWSIAGDTVWMSIAWR